MTAPADTGVPVRRSTLEAGGLRSPVLEAGPAGATEAVVFVHGNPGSSRDWEPLVGQVGAFARQPRGGGRGGAAVP